MYQTYITEALVCGSRHRNTSDKSYLLFTREAGMLFASARSVREEKSKQRYALQDFSLTRATLVSGKGGWRIAGIEPVTNLYYETRSKEGRKVLRNTVRLLKRVMQGEETHPTLYDDLFASLSQCDAYDAHIFELILSLRILYALGYVAPQSEYASILDADTAVDAAGLPDAKNTALLSRVVEHALSSSQL